MNRNSNVCVCFATNMPDTCVTLAIASATAGGNGGGAIVVFPM